tara:strand:+ start:337 stop:639 length:303 start_codon:yes stop_codon:yes gene_type:complete
MASFTQLWAVAGLTAGLGLLLALVLISQQLRISSLRSTRRDLLQQVEALSNGKRKLLDHEFEVQVALRAKHAHVEQLKRKAQLLETAMQDESLHAARSKA